MNNYLNDSRISDQTVTIIRHKLENSEFIELPASHSPSQAKRIVDEINARNSRIPVMQDGRQIGTLPRDFNPDPAYIDSRSPLYDPRPGDFTRVGETWVVGRTLGGGDLEAVPGFVWDRR